jgi:AcrR family transcriptional regulator
LYDVRMSGLRERNKQQIRTAISAVAMKLFTVHGFDDVSITQVANEAGVSKMTVTNHFPHKEDLVFDHTEMFIRSLADAVRARPAGEGVFTAVRRDCAARIAAGDVTLGPPSLAFAQIVHNSRVLSNRAREIADLRERALGDAIAVETAVDDLQLRAAAAQLASVYRVVFSETSQRVLRGEPRDAVFKDLAASVSKIFDRMEPALRSYCIRAAKPAWCGPSES